jgi:hypothetical protein
VADRLLARRLGVDGLQRQRDFDELFLGGHGLIACKLASNCVIVAGTTTANISLRTKLSRVIFDAFRVAK